MIFLFQILVSFVIFERCKKNIIFNCTFLQHFCLKRFFKPYKRLLCISLQVIATGNAVQNRSVCRIFQKRLIQAIISRIILSHIQIYISHFIIGSSQCIIGKGWEGFLIVRQSGGIVSKFIIAIPTLVYGILECMGAVHFYGIGKVILCFFISLTALERTCQIVVPFIVVPL